MARKQCWKKNEEATTELPKTTPISGRGLRVRRTSAAPSPPQHFSLSTSIPSFSIFQTSLPVSVFHFLHSPLNICFLYSCLFPITYTYSSISNHHILEDRRELIMNFISSVMFFTKRNSDFMRWWWWGGIQLCERKFRKKPYKLFPTIANHIFFWCQQR